jgi:hypothetical protein
MTPLLLALLLQSAPAAPACTATVPPPAGLEAWSTISAITMGPISIGQGTGLMLQPIDSIRLPIVPERKPAPGTFGGVYTFNVKTGGTYRVVLEAGAWIDLVRGSESLKSVAHTEGPACSTIRKIVDFDLAPGLYKLQLSGAKKAPMRILIAQK